MERPVLIVDGLNLFTRAYSAFPQMSSYGHQMGGCIGFLKTLQRLSRDNSPSRVCIAWEGGGSQRRRSLFSEYKMNRRPEKLNRFYGDDIPDTDQNRQHQLVTLIAILKSVPVCQIYVPNCEADDVVAFLCKGPYRNNKKIIASSDKDMYQLIDENTNLYSFHKKRFVTHEDIFAEYGIKCHNFAVAKALCGDTSDNIPGIKGFGFKTVASKFPFLGSEQEILIQDVINYAASHSSDSSLYKRLLESQEEFRRNWDLVHLDGSMLSGDQIIRVERLIGTFVPTVNKMAFIKLLIKEGVNDFDTENFFYDFHCIEGINQHTRE